MHYTIITYTIWIYEIKKIIGTRDREVRNKAIDGVLFLSIGVTTVLGSMFALDEITECEVIRMGGFNPRRLFMKIHGNHTKI